MILWFVFKSFFFYKNTNNIAHFYWLFISLLRMISLIRDVLSITANT